MHMVEKGIADTFSKKKRNKNYYHQRRKTSVK